MINALTLVVAILILVLIVAIFIMTFSNSRTVSQIMEYNEAEYAKQEMLERTVGVDKKGQEIIAKVLMHCSRNKIGTAIVIEGKTSLDHIEQSGDSSGIIDINEPMLKTLIESIHTNKGAILIRKNSIVSVNGQMRIDERRQEENRKLINLGLGSRHVGAFGEVMNNAGTVVVVVSEETGKISLFGHLAGKLTADVGLELKEFNIRGGVTQSQIEYRLNDLLVGQGLDASLESEEVITDIARKKETPEQRKARRKREKEVERIKREEEKEQIRAKKEQERKERERERSKNERGKLYTPKEKDSGSRKQQSEPQKGRQKRRRGG